MSIIIDNIKQYAIFIALVIIAVIFHFLTGGVLFRPANVSNLIVQNGYIMVLAIGMTLVIVTGRIDLSVGGIMGLAGALSGAFIATIGIPAEVAFILVLAAGFVIGVFQGYLIAYKNMPFFVVTLAGMMMYRGLTMVFLGGRMIGPFPSRFQAMATGFVPDFLGGLFGQLDFNITTGVVCGTLALIIIIIELNKRKTSRKYGVDSLPMPLFIIKILLIVGLIGLFGYWLGNANGIPVVLVLLGILFVVYSFITNKTIVGRHIYATGGNAKTSELSGVKTKQIVFWVYVNMAMLAALAGMIFVARLNLANPRVGVGDELQAIAAAFIGGASPSGGVGKVSGAIAGAMLIGILDNAMNHIGWSLDARLVVIGLVLLAAVIFDVLMKNRATRRSKNIEIVEEVETEA